LTKYLKNESIRQHFIEKKGLNNIADWLDKLPDGSKPEINFTF